LSEEKKLWKDIANFSKCSIRCVEEHRGNMGYQRDDGQILYEIEGNCKAILMTIEALRDSLET